MGAILAQETQKTSEHEERVAAALRENLRKRKRQAQEREEKDEGEKQCP